MEHPGTTVPAPISIYSCSELQLAMIKCNLRKTSQVI